MTRPAPFVSILLAVATAAASLAAWEEHRQLDALAPEARKSALLSTENDALRTALEAARQDAADARDTVRRAEIERVVTSLRQLPFKQPVEYAVLDHAGIRQVLAGKISETYSDQEIANASTGLSAFGLLPPDYPLKQSYIDLLGEQVAAFYDQHQHKLFMFRGASLENSQNRVILAHELTHALQDQNFGLMKLPLEIKNNDDEADAASALIEGDATLVMSQYMAGDFSWRSLTDTVTYSATQSMEQLRRAPHYLRRMLVFPYIDGQKFCAAVYERGGFAALSAVYADPPSSTAQILHPEKYFKETREDPIRVVFPDTTFQGQKPLEDNVLGEMACQLLFAGADPNGADQIAAGWRGDRYLVFDGGKCLVWTSVWRSAEAANAAAAAIDQVFTRRYHRNAANAGPGPAWSLSQQPEPATSAASPANEVVFILGPGRESLQLLQQKFAGAAHG